MPRRLWRKAGLGLVFVSLAGAGLFLTLPQGQRLFFEGKLETKDRITGTYEAQLEDYTGREPIFGGAMKKGQFIQLSGIIEGTGDVLVQVRTAGKEVRTVFAGTGQFDEIVLLEGGSSYVELKCVGFSGSVFLESV